MCVGGVEECRLFRCSGGLGVKVLLCSCFSFVHVGYVFRSLLCLHCLVFFFGCLVRLGLSRVFQLCGAR